MKTNSSLFLRIGAVPLLFRLCSLLLIGLVALPTVYAQEVCSNGTDDDSDGLIDCEDPECSDYSTCKISPLCSDPFQYYMPPIYGDKTYNCGSYGADDIVISTNGGTATVKIYSPDGTLLQTLIAPTAAPVYYTLPAQPAAGHNQILNGNMNTVMSNTGVIIGSDQPIQVTYRQLSLTGCGAGTVNQDIMQVHGQAALGYSFYPASQTYLMLPTDRYFGVFEKHFVSVMATENATQITFTVPASMQMEGNTLWNTTGTADWTGTRTITLNRGQTYIIASRNEAPNVSVSGIKVTSTKPIVVNSGSQHTRQPQNGDGDAGFQQVIPTQSTGRTYAIIDGGNTTAVKDYLVIIGIKNNTALTINGVSGATDAIGTIMPTTIGPGQVVQYVFSDAVYASYYVQASQNVYCYHVSSYGTGEFGMELLPPLDFCIGNKKIDFDRPGTEAKAIVYVPTAGLPSLRFRGQPYTNLALTISGSKANPIGTTGYSFVVFENGNISAANNRVTCNEKIAVGVLSRTGGTGNYAFYSSYIKDVEVYDPITGQPTLAYTAGTATPNVPITHCMSIGGCGANNSIISLAVDNGGTVSAVPGQPSCFTYTMKTGATPCMTENVSVEVQNEFGIKQKVCVKFQNITSNVTVTTPLPASSPTCIGGTISLNGTATSTVVGTINYLWTTPMGTQVANHSISVPGAVAANAGWYNLKITDASGCVLEKLVNVPVYDCTNFDIDKQPTPIIANANDPDDDNDGILDVRETCGPLAVNYSCLNTVIYSGISGTNVGLDPTGDEDNDGKMNIYDAVDNDGGGDFVNTCADVNLDGLCDAINPIFDHDGDNFPDFWDLDSDNDGIPDVIEVGGVDTDGNGIIDGNDTNNDGLIDDFNSNNVIDVTSLNGLILLDSDNDGLPNTLDLDSDNDGLSDRFEVGGIDSDNNGKVDNFATNGSGFANLHDPTANGVPLVFTGADTGTPDGYANSFPFSDADGDLRQNFLDLDSDNDGLTDLAEAGGADATGDGRVDVLADNPTGAFVGTEDANNNGWVDIHDAGSPLPALDHDSDNFRSYLDRDSDDDGITDLVEAGGVDVTGDGVVDVFADADNDGLADRNDPGGSSYTIGFSTGGTSAQINSGTVTSAPNATGNNNNTFATLNSGATMTLTLGATVPAGGTLFLWLRYNTPTGTAITVETSPNGSTFTNITPAGVVVDNAAVAAYPFNLAASATHVRITVTGSLPLDLDAVTYLFTTVTQAPITAGSPLLLTGADAGVDGLPDSYPNGDKDKDNRYNWLDLDSDNDGLTDIAEAGGADRDGDGRNDYTTSDNDRDGYSDTYDPDDDGTPGTDNVAEGLQPLALTDADINADGIANDGEKVKEGNGGANHDSDQDGLADWLDLDSDNDGLTDLVEANGSDTNGDGLVDYSGTFASNDTDGDGYFDRYDSDDDNTVGADAGETTQPLIRSTVDVNSNGKVDNTEYQTEGSGTTTHDRDGDGRTDFVDLDADNDAITDLIEAGGIDTNGDGVVDGYTDGADNDGYASIYDTDDNNDGTPETPASALVQTSADGNANGKVDLAEGYFAGNGTTSRDTDGDTRPDFVDLDSDNDGIADVVEAGGTDADGNGYIDGYADGADTDGYNNANDPDDTNDGVMEGAGSQLVITAADGNTNGLADLATEYLFAGNGTTRRDFDRDGSVNWRDLDADNDGITDVREAGGASADPDNNGIVGTGSSAAIPDPNGDGFSGTADGKDGGAQLATPNSDGTSGADFLDIDADDDGIVDNVEGQSTAGYVAPTGTDTDGDGIDNQYDGVAGWAGPGIIAVNTDGSDNPDYRDTNSDNDADNDRNEGWDSDNVGGPDVVYAAPDADGDGLVDNYDNDDANINPTNGTYNPAATHPDFDNPGGDRDWREGAADNDVDGVPDGVDLDDDNDGIPDTAESGTDSDGDGIPNWFDLDSDDDGITDIVEAGGPDSDGDGRVDALQTNGTGTFTAGQDSDSDGWWDMYDNTGGSFTTGSPLPLPNSDGTGPANWLDLDSDDDGIVDLIEAGGADLDGDGTVDNTLDVDGDGYYDFYDSDDNGSYGAEDTTDPLVRTSPDANTDGLRNGSELLLNGTAAVNQDTDRDLLPDWLDVDSDNDGIADLVEVGGTDANGDGRIDGYSDTDNDGYSDNRDPDDDGAAGIDAGESTQPSVRTTIDANANGKVDGSEIYTRGDGSTNQDTDLDLIPNFIDLDSDNDGIADVVEAGGIDSDGNGFVDYSGAFATSDTDNDGLVNTYDTDNSGTAILNRNSDGDAIPNYLDLDSDNDGLQDIIEVRGVDANNNGRVDVATDTDNDGWINTYDGDLDNDLTLDNAAAVLVLTSAGGTNGVPASYTRGDFDLDGKYNAIDLDADGDGATDLREATSAAGFVTYDGTLTADIDGIISTETGLLIPDTDGDGWSNMADGDNGGTVITPVNTDAAGLPDFLDIDSDNDGIVDIVEIQTTGGYAAPSSSDDDGDGLANNHDAINGWGGAGLTPTNTDGGDNPDWRDTDTDNDGKNDRIEGWDFSGNGAIAGVEKTFSGVDADADGLDDAYDNNTAVVNPTNGTTPASYPDVNNPGGDRDWRQVQDRDRDGIVDGNDLDDDNDGIPDTAENGGTSPSADSDNDGIWNLTDASSCAGTINTFGVCSTFDKDGDGLANQWDLDTDNDGIPDLIEAGGVDVDGNGLVDALNTDNDYTFAAAGQDTDNDGWWDIFDNSGGSVTNGVNLPTADTDLDGIRDHLDLDSDNDGITDLIEARGVDANGDGIVDTYTDVNLNGFTDVYDPNTDLDYPNEVANNPLIRTSADGDNNGRISSSEVRFRGDGTTREDIDTDGIAAWLDLDSDNDGIPDLVEVGGADNNNDGRVDVATDGIDSDGYASIYDSDDNNDGVVESTTQPLLMSCADVNGDGKLTAADGLVSTWYPLESSGDQGPADADKDGLPNAYDLDSDNDGLSDAREANAGALPPGTYNTQGQITSLTDANIDGWDDGKDGGDVILDPNNDTDADGLADEGYAATDDFDSDKRSDAYDIDADNDGILDADEFQPSNSTVLAVNADADGDGIDNAFDPDCVPCGAVTGAIVTNPENTDLAGQADYLDLDADDDGSRDWIEGFDGSDVNADALTEFLSKMEGWRSANCPGAVAQCAVYSNSVDADADGYPAWCDVNDAVYNSNNGTDFMPPFLSSSNTTYFFDTDKDGLVDIFDVAVDGASKEPQNGISTVGTQAPAASSVLIPDYRNAAPFVTFPVEWHRFEAYGVGEDAQLEWSTASELNNDYFEVERSVDGVVFAAVGRVAGGGTTSNLAAYDFLDRGVAMMGVVWYRLRQVDLDGAVSHSEIRSIRFHSELSLTLAPNPAQKVTHAQILVPNAGTAELRVTDLLGQVLYVMAVPQGLHQMALSLEGLAPGVYVVEVSTENETVAARLVVE